MQPKYTKWEDISISTYNKIRKIQKEDVDDITKEVMVLSVLCECSEDDIWELKMNELNDLRTKLQFLQITEDVKKKKEFKRITIDGVECDVITDLNKFSYAQYVDFQTFYPEEDGLAKILSTAVIPRGKKYNEGYDIVDFIDKISNNVDIVTANSITFFLQKNFLNSIRRINNYFRAHLRVKKMMMRKKNPAYPMIQEAIKSSVKLHILLGSVL